MVFPIMATCPNKWLLQGLQWLPEAALSHGSGGSTPGSCCAAVPKGRYHLKPPPTWLAELPLAAKTNQATRSKYRLKMVLVNTPRWIYMQSKCYDQYKAKFQKGCQSWHHQSSCWLKDFLGTLIYRKCCLFQCTEISRMSLRSPLKSLSIWVQSGKPSHLHSLPSELFEWLTWAVKLLTAGSKCWVWAIAFDLRKLTVAKVTSYCLETPFQHLSVDLEGSFHQALVAYTVYPSELFDSLTL